jgi:hypothetical protein
VRRLRGGVSGFNPSTTTVTDGAIFTLDLEIGPIPQCAILNPGDHCTTDLYAYQLEIDFDPTVFQALDVNDGTLLAMGGTDSFFGGIIDNTGGSITFIENSLVGAANGIIPLNGGDLLSIDFQAINPSPGGLVEVNPGGSCLQDTFDVQNFTCEFSAGITEYDSAVVTVTPAPEPSAAFPFATGLVLLAVGYRKVKQR